MATSPSSGSVTAADIEEELHQVYYNIAVTEMRPPLKESFMKKAQLADRYLDLKQYEQTHKNNPAEQEKARRALQNLVPQMKEVHLQELRFRAGEKGGDYLGGLEVRRNQLEDALLLAQDAQDQLLIQNELIEHLNRFRRLHERLPIFADCIRSTYKAVIDPHVEPDRRSLANVEFQALRRWAEEGGEIADLVRNIVRQAVFLRQHGRSLPAGAVEFMRNLPPSPSWSPHFVETNVAIQPALPPRHRDVKNPTRTRSRLGQFMENATEHSLGTTQLSNRQRAVYAAARARATGRGW